MSHRVLLAVLIAFCAGTAHAQYQGGSSSGSPYSGANAGPLPGGSSGAAKDIQNAPPTKAECERLNADPTLKSGGLLNEDMKAKVEQCKRMKAGAPAPR